jgi:hydroxyacylglutathione hydrolase
MSQEIKPINLGGVNCYLLKTGTKFLLVDTGPANKRFELTRELENAGCRPGDLDLILATHGDSDHVGNCAFLHRRYGATIVLHRAEVDAVKFGNPVLNKNLPHGFRGMMIRMIVQLFRLKPADCFAPDVLIDDGCNLASYGLDAQVLHIPGHSRGSIGVLTSRGDLLCGDLLKNTRYPAPGFGIFDRLEFDATIEKLRPLNIQMVYPGHGKPFAWEQFMKNHRSKAG